MYQSAIAKASTELREAVKAMRDALGSIIEAGNHTPVVAANGAAERHDKAKAAAARYDGAVVALDRARSGD